MRAFLSRLHIGGNAKDKDSPTKEKVSGLGPLPQWPPQQPQQQPIPAPIQKPLPDIAESRSQSTPTPNLQNSSLAETASTTIATSIRTASPRAASPRIDIPDPDSTTIRQPKKTANGGSSLVDKKVAFISPSQSAAPTPTTDRVQPEFNAHPANGTTSPVLKSSVSRFQATHSSKEPRGSTSTAASSSKTDVGSTSKGSAKATSTRTVSPFKGAVEAGSMQSLRSGTPYSSMSNNTNSSRILSATSWSEVTEGDLVLNLGSRERTRQEVLFEIISSEERYVNELFKMKETFIDPLLHPFSATNTSPVDYDYYARVESPAESTDNLPPIAARFMSPSPTASRPTVSSTPNIDGESVDTDEEEEGHDQIGKGFSSRKQATVQAAKLNHPRSPYRSALTTKKSAAPVPFPTRSHQSLPPPPRVQMTSSTHSLGRQSIVNERAARERNNSQGNSARATPTPKQGLIRKLKKSQTAPDSVFNGAIAPHQLPADLRICLEVVDSGVFDGHKRLHEALHKRYNEQFPLVRSLADVFVSNSDIFHGYATYVLHLERALQQVDDALNSNSKKLPKKQQDSGEYLKVCQFLQRLEEIACEKGETGLAITLSKPFQRLLKYPLLFQNLLFHTDPSTFEYESTLQMVAEVETIVRSIEDEKIQKEERDKTRDVFARIEGLDKVRQLALPKPSRVLIEERQCAPISNSGLSKPGSPPPAINGKGVRGKSSFKRLSDALSSSNGVGGKKDLWFVVFNDVVLQCQRTGTTSLPLVAATNSRTNSLPELQGKAKYATTGRRNTQTKPRNLYKFIKIETWAIGGAIQPREGVVSMEDVARHAQVHANQPRIVPMPEDDEDGGDSDDSDRKSKMSFSYWGADKITVQKPIIRGKPIIPNGGPRRGGGNTSPSYGRESSANAKFGTRLVSNDSSPTPRPASRRTQGTPVSRRQGPSDEGNSTKSTITRPAWDNTNTRSPQPGQTAKRTRNVSQTSAATRVAAAAKSPEDSDSGLGLPRAKDN